MTSLVTAPEIRVMTVLCYNISCKNTQSPGTYWMHLVQSIKAATN